jgi:hypothetical protein
MVERRIDRASDERKNSFMGIRMRGSSTKIRILIVTLVIIALSPILRFGMLSLMRQGVSYWERFDLSSRQIPFWLQSALTDTKTLPKSGSLKWRTLRSGLEAADWQVYLGDSLVDTLQLIRVDPGQYTFAVYVDPFANRDVDNWIDVLGAVALVNGSYYDYTGHPQTPVLSNGERFGPDRYKADHGAFVAGKGSAMVVDLESKDWSKLFQAYTDGLVSYPLLLDEQGTVRAAGHDTWVANRSFIGKDSKGRIVIGTTKHGYFSLRRLGRFLKSTSLGLAIALNLDGGPLACQAIRTAEVSKSFCGEWEIMDDSKGYKMLKTGAFRRRWALPIVIAVFPA